MPNVFVSYSRHDSEFVAKLVARLQQKGITVFYDKTCIAVGDSIAASISAAIREADFVLVIMSPDYFNSSWATKEMEMAIAEEFERRTIKVIPILYRDTEIPPILLTKVYADFSTEEEFDASFSILLKALNSQSPLSPETDPATADVQQTIGTVLKSVLESDDVKNLIAGIRADVSSFVNQSSVSPVNCTPVSITVNPNLCFVIMPFSPVELNDIYEYFIKPVIEGKCGLQCERGDDVFGSNVIMDDIRGAIEKASIVVADLTGKNPNVFYEVGIAHTLNKPVLLLSQSMSDVPFDLRHRRVLLYESTPKGCCLLRDKMAEHIIAMMP